MKTEKEEGESIVSLRFIIYIYESTTHTSTTIKRKYYWISSSSYNVKRSMDHKRAAAKPTRPRATPAVASM